MPEYWAHSDPDGLPPDAPGVRWQPLREHLIAVGLLAQRLASRAGASEVLAGRARAAGLLHDIGKYSDAFQRRLRGDAIKAPHSIHGAALGQSRARAADVAFAVAGHHAGMSSRPELRDRVAAADVLATGLWERAVADCPELGDCFQPQRPLLGPIDIQDPLDFDLDCRMLLGCLVDADRLDTAGHASGRNTKEQVFVPMDSSSFFNGLMAAVDNTT